MQRLCHVIPQILCFLLFRRKQKQEFILLIKIQWNHTIIGINYQKAASCFIFFIYKPRFNEILTLYLDDESQH